jgi:hypothetical protein
MLYETLADSNVPTILFRSLIGLVLVVVGFLAIKAIAKWMNTDDIESIGAGFSLSDLRQLHSSGKMSTEEFEKAKAILLAAAQKPPTKPQTTQRPPL